METKLVSSLAKVFPDEICNATEISSVNCLKNERASFQIVIRSDADMRLDVKTDCEFLTLYEVRFVPAGLTAPDDRDDYFIRSAEPGDYPDVLIPSDGTLTLKKGEWLSLWCEFAPNGEMAPGTHTITVTVGDEKIPVAIQIADASFGEQSLMCTHWFHTDCLASYYDIKIFSDDYWRIVENFMRDAVRHGINMILTPLFTPPLDTEVGGERPTVQLIDVKKHGYTYTFGFEKLKKWVELANKCGVKYFELSHLFTQWGAKHAPKVMAETSTGYRRIFGWETNAHSQGYENFLRQLAPELTAFLNENGLRDRCCFHASDEPNLKDYFSYKKSAKLMQELFGDFKRIDALSEFTFYRNGLIDYPVTGIASIEKFAGKVPELWTYYCCGPYKESMPNRFVAMPSLRSRILGFLMYQYDVKGFLHWGYNFYYTQYSKRKVDPFTETDAGGAFSSGDAFVVYPAKDGTPYDSLRLKVFYEAIQDFEALRLLEAKIGREKTLAVLNDGLDKPLTVRSYPHSEEWLLAKRSEINNLLAI